MKLNHKQNLIFNKFTVCSEKIKRTWGGGLRKVLAYFLFSGEGNDLQMLEINLHIFANCLQTKASNLKSIAQSGGLRKVGPPSLFLFS